MKGFWKMKCCCKSTIKKGFTMAETLLSLLLVSICSLLLVPLLQLSKTMSMPLKHNDDLIAIMQLRYILAQSSSIQLKEDALNFRYHAQDWSLSLHNEKIVKEPGYEIFMQKIQKGEFYEIDNCMYLHYERKDSAYGLDAALWCR